ncbi:hypothetical protein ACQR1W_12150 [Bradyrhizobium sp. HKCCYLS1011]|uniref:hypothetical protein n=1 Tax=Bradyrhizobium sp. HKCCYLS1011 TaxID=3420733 RepID=UPI003EC0A3C4
MGGGVIRAIGLSCVLLAALGSQASAAVCVVPKYRTLANQTVQGNMFVASGKRCGVVSLITAGPTFGPRVLQQPAHGRVSIEGRRVVYISRPGYVGEDSFVFARDGLDTLNKPRTNTIEMHVQVSERL